MFDLGAEYLENSKGLILGFQRYAPYVIGVITGEANGEPMTIDRGGLLMFLQFLWPGEWPVHSQCPRSHDCDVPINYIMGTS